MTQIRGLGNICDSYCAIITIDFGSCERAMSSHSLQIVALVHTFFDKTKDLVRVSTVCTVDTKQVFTNDF